MSKYTKVGSLEIDNSLYDFVKNKIIANIDIDNDVFWGKFEEFVAKNTNKNEELLLRRDELQEKIDTYSKNNDVLDIEKYKAFLYEIGYLVEEKEDFNITTSNVDDEIATICGPQLVVPANNARFALNAANARWGSLYDSLYGTDVIDTKAEQSGFCPVRAVEVIKYANGFLDKTIPLESGSYGDVESFSIDGKTLQVTIGGQKVGLKDNSKLKGYRGDKANPSSLLFENNNLHIEIAINPNAPAGKLHKSGISDIILESAVSTIVDFEDSVTAVDGEDKALVYSNWFELMNGDLSTSFEKNGKTIQRKLNSDRVYKDLDDEKFSLNGRSLLLCRNVGFLMKNSAVLYKGDEVFENMLDGMMMGLISLYEKQNKVAYQNSKKGSVYIVKPKMHGPDEVAFASDLFAQIEKTLKLNNLTFKMGIMDEERRTTLNLKECIRSAKDRVSFINTGFLDRTGDEMHTSMLAGIMDLKANMKSKKWLLSYEDSNVDIGLLCGFSGKAQIGKGMYAQPDDMKNMLKTKIAHLQAGGNCAWVPSPTAATLHAIHYHEVNVFDLHKTLKSRERATKEAILEVPIVREPNWSDEVIIKEIENNAQGILGYVSRWINQGIGCSKVPDIHNVALMEDRATLRISSQHLCNWLEHKVITGEQFMTAMKKMAKIVDEQNKNDNEYENISSNFDNIAFKAACELVTLGKTCPNGYTEPILHQQRNNKKKEL